VIRLQAHSLRHFGDGQRALLGEQGTEQAFVFRIQVLNQYESHSYIGGKIRQQFCKRFDASR
jgi:hypothetical protein